MRDVIDDTPNETEPSPEEELARFLSGFNDKPLTEEEEEPEDARGTETR